MTQTWVIAVAGGAVATMVAVSIIAVVRWVRKQFDPIIVQLKPNGGSSAVDKINSLHDQFTAHKTDVDRRFDDVDKHLDRQDRRIDGLYRPDKDIIR